MIDLGLKLVTGGMKVDSDVEVVLIAQKSGIGYGSTSFFGLTTILSFDPADLEFVKVEAVKLPPGQGWTMFKERTSEIELDEAKRKGLCITSGILQLPEVDVAYASAVVCRYTFKALQDTPATNVGFLDVYRGRRPTDHPLAPGSLIVATKLLSLDSIELESNVLGRAGMLRIPIGEATTIDQEPAPKKAPAKKKTPAKNPYNTRLRQMKVVDDLLQVAELRNADRVYLTGLRRQDEVLSAADWKKVRRLATHYGVEV